LFSELTWLTAVTHVLFPVPQGVFDEDVARLYTAEIVAALSYLHERGIVHRWGRGSHE
jgi:serine/threonine protein kinase